MSHISNETFQKIFLRMTAEPVTLRIYTGARPKSADEPVDQSRCIMEMKMPVDSYYPWLDLS
jgi:hypothetical protein